MKKFKPLFKGINTLLMSFILGIIVLSGFNYTVSISGYEPVINPIIGGIAGMVLNLSINIASLWINSISISIQLYATALNKEIWLPIIIEQLRQPNDFLDDGVDLDSFVENNTINLAEAGVDPAVVVNRTSYPIPVTPITDINNPIPLDTFSSDSTPLFKAETVELSYDKMASITSRHALAIFDRMSSYALNLIAPNANTTATPVLKATGAISANSGLKIVTLGDIGTLSIALDNQNLPQQGRVIVMPPIMYWDFVMNNGTALQAAAFNSNTGELKTNFVQIGDFIVRRRTGTPYYHGTSLNKLAYGGTVTSSYFQAALVYVKQRSFARAKGTLDMFYQPNDPHYQADIINFLLRAKVTAYRQKEIAAIMATT